MKVYNVANKDETAFYSSGYGSRYEAEELRKISIQHDPDAHVVEYEVKTELEKVQEELADVKAERDAAVKELELVAEKVEQAASVIDNNLHPVIDYNIYLEMRNAVDAIAVWQYEPVWRSAPKEEAK